MKTRPTGVCEKCWASSHGNCGALYVVRKVPKRDEYKEAIAPRSKARWCFMHASDEAERKTEELLKKRKGKKTDANKRKRSGRANKRTSTTSRPASRKGAE